MDVKMPQDWPVDCGEHTNSTDDMDISADQTSTNATACQHENKAAAHAQSKHLVTTSSGVAASTRVQNRALPLSSLGLNHWMEALMEPSLNPEIPLVDLVQAYFGKADFDNCTICQRVIDSSFLSLDDEDEQMETSEAPQNSTELACTAETSAAHSEQAQTEDTSSSCALQAADTPGVENADTLGITSPDKNGKQVEEEKDSRSQMVRSVQNSGGVDHPSCSSVQNSSDEVLDGMTSFEEESMNRTSVVFQMTSEDDSAILSTRLAQGCLKGHPAELKVNGLSAGGSTESQPAGDQPKNLSAENNMTDLSAENNMTDLSAENNMTDLSAEDNVTDLSAENNVTDLSAENNVTDLSAEDNVTDLSAENNVTDLSAEDNVTDLSAENNVTDLSAENNMTDLSAENNMTDLSAENNMTDLSAENNMTDLSAENNMTDLSAENNVTDLENNMTDLSAENNVTDLENNMTDLSAENNATDLENNMTDLSAENNATDLEDNMTDLSAENNMTDLSAENNVTDLSAEDNVTDLSAEDNMTDLSAEDNMTDLSAEDNMTDLSAEDNMTDLSAEDNMTDLSAEDNMTDLSAEDNMTDLSAEDNMTDLSAEDNMTDLSAEDNVTDLSAEDNMTDLSAEDNVTDLSAEDNMTDLSAEDNVTDLSAEDNMTDLSAENNMTDLSAEDNVTDLSAENNVTDLEDNMTDLSAEDNVTDLSAENNVTDLEDNMTDLSAEDNVTDLSAENNVTDLSAEDNVTDLSAEDIMTDMSAPEDNTKDLPVPTEDNTKDLPVPTEDNTKDLPTENNKDLAPEDTMPVPAENIIKDLPVPTEDNIKDLPTEDNMKDLSAPEDSMLEPAEDNIKDLPTENNIKDLPTEDNIKDLPTENNIKDLPTEDNIKDLPTENNIKDLPTEDNIKDLPTEDNIKDLPTEDNIKDLSGHKATNRLEFISRDSSSKQAAEGQSADVMTMEQSADEICEQDPTSCNLQSSLLPIVELADGDVMPLSKQKDRSGGSPLGFFNSRRRYRVGCSTGVSFPRKGRLPPSSSHSPRKHVQLCRAKFSVNMGECFISPEMQNDTHFEKDIAAGLPIPTLASGARESREMRKCLHQLHKNTRDQVSHGFHFRQSVYYKSTTSSSTLSQYSVKGYRQHEAFSHPSYYHQYQYGTQIKSYKPAASEHGARESLHQDSSRRDLVDYFQDIIGEKRKAASDEEAALGLKRLKRDLSAWDRHGLKQKQRVSGSSKTNSASFDCSHERKRKAASSEALRRNDSENRSSAKRPKVSRDMEKGGAPSKSHGHRGHDKLSKTSEKDTAGNKSSAKKSADGGMKKVSNRLRLFSDPRKRENSVKSGKMSVDKRSQEREQIDKSRISQKGEQRKNERNDKDDRVSQTKGLKLSSDKHYTQQNEKATISTVTRSEEDLYRHSHSPQGFCTVDERSFCEIQRDVDTVDHSEIDRCSLPLPGTSSAVLKDPGILENRGLSSQSQEDATCKRSQSFKNEVHQEESAAEMFSVMPLQEPDTKDQDLGISSHEMSSHQIVNAIAQEGETNQLSEASIPDQRRDHSGDSVILTNTGKFHGLAGQKESEVADLDKEGSLSDLQSHEHIKSSSAGRRTGLSWASACGSRVPDSNGDACFANCVNHSGKVKQTAAEERKPVHKSDAQRTGDIQPQEQVAYCTSQANVLSADPIVSVPTLVDTKGNDANAVRISDNLALPLKKESFTGKQINLELEIINGCLRLLEACRREDDQADSTLRSLPVARLSDAEAKTLRMSLCAVLKDFRHSIDCIKKGLKGKPHHCMPQELLLREERNQLYTREGVFVVLVSSIPQIPYKELLKIKAALEDGVESGGTTASDQSRMPDQIDQIQQRRKILMETHTGTVKTRLLNKLHKQAFSYTVCRDHMNVMLGHETVTKMIVFRSSFEAVQHHLQLVEKELRIAECKKNNKKDPLTSPPSE